MDGLKGEAYELDLFVVCPDEEVSELAILKD